jgi:hypothetical protein
MWIRTQDKKGLIDCTDIRIVNYTDCCRIWDYNVDETLGKYETEQRALEVLDEIQEQMTQRVEITDMREIANYEMESFKSYFVFQMPKH